MPYFLVPGVAKCGSTGLFNILQMHHLIVPPNKKETGGLLKGVCLDFCKILVLNNILSEQVNTCAT